MTDLCALVARMADELDHYRQLLMDDRRETHALATKARIALAEQRPAADGEVAELVAWLRENADDQREMSNGENPASRNLTRAADLLESLSDGPIGYNREPASVVEQPSDEELRELWVDCWDTSEECGAFQFARAVLARWGNCPAQPIPVAERLPEAGDCDAEGRCWMRSKVEGDWRLVSATNPDVPHLKYFFTHWLPANALPLPSGEVE